MSAVIAAVASLAYAACWLAAARWWYGRIRPWSEPLACSYPGLCRWRGAHGASCYRRWGMVDGRGEAAFWALLFGVTGPLAAVVILAGRVIMASPRPLPEELEARTARLERENARLRAELGGGR